MIALVVLAALCCFLAVAAVVGWRAARRYQRKMDGYKRVLDIMCEPPIPPPGPGRPLRLVA